MLDINPELNFEPSKTTKALWRYVRTSPTTFGGVTLPGLFQSSNFALDTFGFALALGLEGWGLVNLLQVGHLDPLFVVFLFALDLVFAVCRHLPVGGIRERENRLVVVDDPAEKEKLLSEIRQRRLVMLLFTLLMLCIALFKVLSFQALQGGDFNGLTAAILVSYLITWVLHISVTGNFLFGLCTAAFLRYDQARFVRGGHSRPAALSVTTYRRHSFPSRVPLASVKVYRHTLEPVAPDNRTYELRTWGMLTDDQLHSLIGAQADSEAKRQVAVQGLTHQLDILQSAPPRSQESSGTRSGEAHNADGGESGEANGRSALKTGWDAPPAAQAKSLVTTRTL